MDSTFVIDHKPNFIQRDTVVLSRRVGTHQCRKRIEVNVSFEDDITVRFATKEYASTSTSK